MMLQCEKKNSIHSHHELTVNHHQQPCKKIQFAIQPQTVNEEREFVNREGAGYSEFVKISIGVEGLKGSFRF